MLRKLFEVKFYVRVLKNQFEIDNLSNGTPTKVVSATEAFTTRRLLVGEFAVAEQCLRDGIKSSTPSGLVKRGPAILIHPIEMTEGGLSEVENRIFRELALGVGAHRTVLWVGDRLTPRQAIEKLESA